MTNYKRLIQKLRKLNQRYQQVVLLHYKETKSKLPSDFDAEALNVLTSQPLIVIRGRRRALHPEILAHEYAHTVRDKQVMRKDGHSFGFFSTYKEVCSVLNLEPKNLTTYSCGRFRATLNYPKRRYNEH